MSLAIAPEHDPGHPFRRVYDAAATWATQQGLTPPAVTIDRAGEDEPRAKARMVCPVCQQPSLQLQEQRRGDEAHVAYWCAGGCPHTDIARVLGVSNDVTHEPLRSRLLSRAQLANLPQPAPLIDNTLELRSIAVLSGRRGRGKSLIGLDWALCIASGKRWQTRDVEPGSVLWVAAEGAYGMDQRVAAWEYAWQHTAEHLTVLPESVNLYSGRGVDELTAIVQQDRPRLVVFDTWARCTVGGKENDNSDATRAVDRLEPLRHAGATVLLIAHTDAEDTKTRGATALEDNVDTVYRIAGDPDHLVLKRTKRKDGPEHDELHLKLKTTLGSVVIEAANQVDMTGRRSDVMSIFMSTFGAIGATKADLRKACEEAGITSSGTYSRAVNDLVKAGALINTGTDFRPYYKPGNQS